MGGYVEPDHNYQPHWICQYLRALRKGEPGRGMSLDKLGEQIGVPGNTLGSYERGQRDPNLHRVDRILAHYGYRLVVEKIPNGDPALPTPDEP